MGEFQQLQEIDGLEISAVSAIYMVVAEMIYVYFILKKGRITLQFTQIQQFVQNLLHGIKV